MELRYFNGNPAFPFEGKEGGVQSVWEMKLATGEAVAPHSHMSDLEVYVVIDGMGEMQVGEEKNTVLAGDVVLIPANVEHSASNPSDAPLHVVGVLWRSADLAMRATESNKEENVMRTISASAALDQIKDLASFAGQLGQQIDAAGVGAEERKERMAFVEDAIMKSIGKIWADYSGRI
ncbi:MAG: cupin domain-containing protein [Planctomycetes bacterium]|nr:cupin domain-containing protein [Planctomycetota bacterium]